MQRPPDINEFYHSPSKKIWAEFEIFWTECLKNKLEQRLCKELILSFGCKVELSMIFFFLNMNPWVPYHHGIEVPEGGADIDTKEKHMTNVWESELIIPIL